MRSDEQTHELAQRGSASPARRILIVEDEPIIALNYASILQDAGYQVVGPVSTINEGIAIVEREPVDGAVLDIDINGVPVDPIIMALRRKRLPYIFVSALRGMEGPYNDALFLDKPCTAAELIRAVHALLVQAQARRAEA